MDIEIIEIKVEGYDDNGKALSLDNNNYDIAETIEILQIVKTIIEEQCKNRPIISYRPCNGSLNHQFIPQEPFPARIMAHNIDDITNFGVNSIPRKPAQCYEKLQKIAIKKNTQITINTINSIQKSSPLKMNKDTNFVVADYLIHGEFYFYGQVMQDGGNMKTHVYLQTKDYGVIKISTSSDTIIQYQKSGDLIHHNYVCIRATALQHMITGKLTNIKFKDLITVENNLNLNISHDSIYNWDNDIQNAEQLVKEIRKVI